MPVSFAKMHGLGNDFVVVDAVRQNLALDSAPDAWSAWVRQLADRRTGIGFDQLLVLEPPHSPDADFRYRVFNPDGAEVDQCGNGARCAACFAAENGLAGDALALETRGAAKLAVRRRSATLWEVDMGVPATAPSDVPFLADAYSPTYALALDDGDVVIGALSMGNPHAVLFVDDADTAALEAIGPRIERHERFPDGANVGFAQALGRDALRLRVHERGVGAETPACGSGACAAAVSGRLRGLLDGEVTVHMPGGSLAVRWPGDGESVQLAGPATTVFEGQLRLGALGALGALGGDAATGDAGGAALGDAALDASAPQDLS